MNVLEYMEAFGTSEGVKKAWESRLSHMGDAWQRFLKKAREQQDRADEFEEGGRPRKGVPTSQFLEDRDEH